MKVDSYNLKTKAVREKLLPYLKNMRQFEIETEKKSQETNNFIFFVDQCRRSFIWENNQIDARNKTMR